MFLQVGVLDHDQEVLLVRSYHDLVLLGSDPKES